MATKTSRTFITMNDMKLEGRILAAALMIAGCGSGSTAGSGAPGPSGDAGGAGQTAETEAGAAGETSCAGAEGSWKDDGTLECASSALADHAIGNMSDTLELVFTQPNLTTGLTIVISSPTTLGGSYSCVASPASTVEITYRDPAANSTTVQSCTVTLSFIQSDAGVSYVVGTFSALLTVPDGGIKMITDGMFGVPVTKG